MSHDAQQAPDPLETVRAFVNTLDVETGVDELADPAAARKWIAAHALPGADEAADDEDVERMVAVREALRALLHANNAGEKPPAAAVAQLNRQSEAVSIGLHFGADGSAIQTRCSGAYAAIASLLATVHESMHDGTWQRLKVCLADDCQWAFYDQSKNRSATWCTMSECGNRAKARNYRARQKGKALRAKR
jgi:predicted RNA-binding Zn ribbon-like protein